MKNLTTTVVALLAALATVLAGCGGGVGTGGTGGYAQGAITGFGSVFVNGVRYDDTEASVQDDDGAPSSRDLLRLGMQVEIDSDAVATTPAGASAKASRIRYASEMVGLLNQVDTVNARLTLLGQTVQVGASTVFDDTLSGGIQALRSGQRVKVYAAWDAATGRYRATRIEKDGGSGNFRLRGVVSQLNTVARTLRIGTGAFTYGGTLPAGVADNAFVRVQVQAAPADTAVWTVLGLSASAPQLPEGREARVKGLISRFTSLASFSVNGVEVNAANATFPGGNALAAGVRVEIEGRASGGVLVAAKVSIETDEEEEAEGFELEGSISAPNPRELTFRLRNVLVSYARPDIVYEHGNASNIVESAKVGVKGTLSADGTRLEARRIEFKD